MSQCSNIKILQEWAASSTISLLFIFCLQQVYKHLSGSVWSKGVWSVWSLPCWAGHCKDSKVCFTFNRMRSVPCCFPDTKWKKISASHHETDPYIVWSIRNIYNVQKRKGNGHTTSWSRPQTHHPTHTQY